jgi:hypothetical protein
MPAIGQDGRVVAGEVEPATPPAAYGSLSRGAILATFGAAGRL